MDRRPPEHGLLWAAAALVTASSALLVSGLLLGPVAGGLGAMAWLRGQRLLGGVAVGLALLAALGGVLALLPIPLGTPVPG